MIYSLRPILMSLVLLLLLGSQSRAKDITLAWDANPEPDVAGYKIYYQAESSAPPLKGWGAIEGDSPITVGKQTSVKLTGLMDDQTYYFAVSAFNAAGVESPLSDIVASAAVPVLTAPGRGETGVGRPVTFRWDYGPFAAGMSYTLLIGTDPQLPVTATQSAAMPAEGNHSAALAGLLGLGMLGGGMTLRRRRAPALLLWAAACFSLAACGGGGGGGGGSGSGATSGVAVTAPAVGADTMVIKGLTTPFATITDLQPGTTYYWQVHAVDAQGYRYESLIHAFTTTPQ